MLEDIARDSLRIAAAGVLAVGDDEEVLAENTGAIQRRAGRTHRVADRGSAARRRDRGQSRAQRGPIVRRNRAQFTDVAGKAVETNLDGKVRPFGDERVCRVEHLLDRLLRNFELRPAVAGRRVLHRARRVDDDRDRRAEALFDCGLVWRVGGRRRALAPALRGLADFATGGDRDAEHQNGNRPCHESAGCVHGVARPPMSAFRPTAATAGSLTSADTRIKEPAASGGAPAVNPAAAVVHQSQVDENHPDDVPGQETPAGPAEKPPDPARPLTI